MCDSTEAGKVFGLFIVGCFLFLYVLAALYILANMVDDGKLKHIPEGHKRAIVRLVAATFWPVTFLYYGYQYLKE